MGYMVEGGDVFFLMSSARYFDVVAMRWKAAKSEAAPRNEATGNHGLFGMSRVVESLIGFPMVCLVCPGLSNH